MGLTLELLKFSGEEKARVRLLDGLRGEPCQVVPSAAVEAQNFVLEVAAQLSYGLLGCCGGLSQLLSIAKLHSDR